MESGYGRTQRKKGTVRKYFDIYGGVDVAFIGCVIGHKLSTSK
jgi:hypothetical protein